MWKNNLMHPANGFEKKVHLQVFKMYFFLHFCPFFKLISCTNTVILLKIWDHIFQAVFSELFWFSLQSSKVSRNMHKFCVKFRNTTIYPPSGPIFQKQSFFLNVLRKTYWSELQKLFSSWQMKDIEENNHGFENSAAL